MPRSPKEEFRPFFLALQADCKSFPGGITAVAERVGVTKFTLANAINPDQLASSPPSLGVLLEIITRTQAKRSVFELCRLVGQVPVDMELEHRQASESIHLFLELTRRASTVISAGATAIEDGRFDSEERKEIDDMLADLMQAATELRASLRGA